MNEVVPSQEPGNPTPAAPPRPRSTRGFWVFWLLGNVLGSMLAPGVLFFLFVRFFPSFVGPMP
jgi:hypothetical protein